MDTVGAYHPAKKNKPEHHADLSLRKTKTDFTVRNQDTQGSNPELIVILQKSSHGPLRHFHPYSKQHQKRLFVKRQTVNLEMFDKITPWSQSWSSSPKPNKRNDSERSPRGPLRSALLIGLSSGW